MRTPVDLECEGVTFSSAPLPYERAEDLLPEIGQLVALVLDKGGRAVANLPDDATLKNMSMLTLGMIFGPSVVAAADRLGAGGLKRLAPLVFAATEAVMVDDTGKKARYELGKAKDRAAVFDAHPETYFAALFHAGKVTFGRFFPARAPRA